ncbi:MAG TPA: hypothetical protein PK358_17915 [Spirochaetota bacterium]|nr:hypothetical protein [Spirochaetota bacterium]HPJ36718.1 hypothetical protein [Spirochaetota bacterium]
MFKRKKKLIDKKFQLRSVFTIISITAVFMIIAVLVMTVITAENKKLMKESVDGLNRAIDVENAIVDSFIEYKQSGAGSSLVIRADAVKADHEKAIEKIRGYVSGLESLIRKNYYIIAGILALFFLQSIVFCLYLIRYTHRIAGPVLVISNYMERIINGENAGFRELRNRDELKELHAKFIEMVTLLEENRNEKAQ